MHGKPATPRDGGRNKTRGNTLAGKLTDRLRRLHKPRSAQDKASSHSATAIDKEKPDGSSSPIHAPDKIHPSAIRDKQESALRHGSPLSKPNLVPNETREEEATRNSETRAIGDTLRRSYALRRRGASPTPHEDVSATQHASHRPSKSSNSTFLGPRLQELREDGEDHLATGNLDAARACFMEIVALSPNHPVALSHLVALSERRGDEVLRQHFQSRLDAASPY
jgi:hypothetical protein